MKNKYNRVVVVLQVILQLSTSLFPFAAFAHNSDPPLTVSTGPGGPQKQDGTLEQALSGAESYGGQSLERWLNQWGTAQVSLNVDNEGDWDGSAIDLLTPLWQTPKTLFFAEAGFRAPDGRNTGNMGLGIRRFLDSQWMIGTNIFFDDDFSGNNRRVGIGLEAWRDYLKLSANSYFGTTGWHRSADFDHYQEKSADGFDLRAEGYLPACPQLGGKIIYEHYIGNDVALFDKNDRQRYPSAVTLGISYTPVPLISLGADYRRGESARDDAAFTLDLHYEAGMSWAALINPDNVAAQRTLTGSRTALVARNNEIILQYRQEHETRAMGSFTLQRLTDNSPADGVTSNRITLHASTPDGAPAPNIPVQWRASGHAALGTANGVTDARGVAETTLTDTLAEPVTVEATAGGITHSVVSHFGESQAALTLAMEKDNSPADGVSQNRARARLTSSDGKPRAGVKVSWSTSGSATLTNLTSVTDETGSATVALTSQTPGAVTLRVSADGKTATTTTTFSAPQPAGLSLSMVKDQVVADNQSRALAQARVTDGQGRPLPGVTVQWRIDGSNTAQLTSPASVVTSSDGIARVSLKDRVAEAVTLSATARDMHGSVVATFVAAPPAALTVSMTLNHQLADNLAINRAQATLTDTTGQPVANAALHWRLEGSATASLASPADVTTDASGHATVNLKDPVAESVTVIASAGRLEGQATASFSTVPVGGVTVTIPTNNAPADGGSVNEAQVVVKDIHARPMSGISVSWTLSSATAHAASPVTVTTDAQGQARLTFTDTVPETLSVTARAQGKSGSADARFTAVVAKNLVLSVLSDNAPADNASVNRVKALVTDGSGKPVNGASVAWSISGSGTAKLTTPAWTTTDAQGVTTAELKDSVAQPVSVIASADGITNRATVNFAAVSR
ncbi:Invasin [Cronobacter condimenti 1330]|uniref:Invasin n=1 Tax=Cronobacter condimenti 1330 TaxID=1073999 RepID=K8A191_9ENTR|nr:inverse autotransporter beta domain-containing protein [Cronobacter condimenti]ALB62871.1 Invasin [Cronobacter condimenti 1330]CCJ73243.1 Invasin [Cronobacter condimenti 1330]